MVWLAGGGDRECGGALVWLSFWVSPSDLLGFWPYLLSHLGIWQSAEDSPLVPSMSTASKKKMASLWVSLGSFGQIGDRDGLDE